MGRFGSTLRRIAAQAAVRAGLLLWIGVSAAAAIVLPSGTSAAGASIRPLPVIVDDWGRSVAIPMPLRRIVSLAPHATELLAAAGLADALVAVDPNSDRPTVLRGLPRVAAYPVPDAEALVALLPDLVVVWGPGISVAGVTRLEGLGLRVLVSDPRTVLAVADAIDTLAGFSAQPAAGRATAAALRERHGRLVQRHAARAAVPVFVQAWDRPLTTLGNLDIVGDVLRTCGARNVFADAPIAAPQVGIEQVLARAPRLVLAVQGERGRALWKSSGLLEGPRAVRFLPLDPDVSLRPGPRIIDVATQVCDAVDALR